MSTAVDHPQEIPLDETAATRCASNGTVSVRGNCGGLRRAASTGDCSRRCNGFRGLPRQETGKDQREAVSADSDRHEGAGRFSCDFMSAETCGVGPKSGEGWFQVFIFVHLGTRIKGEQGIDLPPECDAVAFNPSDCR